MIQNLEELNPKYRDFFKVGSLRHEALAKQSISGSVPDEFNSPVGVGIDKNYLQYLYANVDSDKAKRMREYRVMAAFSKVADALDEICDEIINDDENGEIAILKLKGKEFQTNVTKELTKEFQRIVEYFDFSNKGWEYFRHLLVDGELFFEHIIHKDYKNAGILGILNIPCEIIDPIYDNVQNFIIKGFILKKPEIVENKGMKRSPINTKVELIPMDRNQVTYIHSGIWNDDKTMRLPFIENARRAYRQLSLIEDSIIIYRLVRAPERLVFDVDVGNMAAPKAEAYLKKLMHQYWQKKTFDTGSGTGTINAFNPQTMLDSFWFAKRAGSEGTKVTMLPGGCLAMDTRIPLLDGRILTLSEMTEEYKVGKQNWIYSCNPSSGEIVPGKVSWAGVTQESADVMKLTFDNEETLICTPDHMFPIIGKGFVSANELEVNESMIPFNIREHNHPAYKSKSQYHQIYQNNSRKWEFTHRIVAEFMKKQNKHNEYVYSEKYKDFNYTSWGHLRREHSLFNHKIVKIERLSEKIQVGTLTIDKEEQYHNFHTFALDCGIFTKNSNLGQLDDLYYFAKELYRSLKVPTNRVDPESRFNDGTEILREELKFAKFIIRLQKAVATSLKSMYITHLKLRGLWEIYELKEDNIFVELNPPNNFYELREQQKFELKANNFNTMTSNQMISQSYAQKKYLGWKDEDIAANREWLKKDAALKFELMQTENAGPNWRAHYDPNAVMAGTEPGAGGIPGGVPPGGASPLGGMLPSFGPPPKEGEEGEEGAEGAPEPVRNTPPLGKPSPNQKQPGKNK
jgi:hypothetical protein